MRFQEEFAQRRDLRADTRAARVVQRHMERGVFLHNRAFLQLVDSP